MSNGALDGARSLDRLRAEGFVGRSSTLAAITASLQGAAPQRVHLVHGPGGIGKTTLLDAADRVGRAAQRAVHRLDGRDVVGSPGAVSEWYGSVADVTAPGLLLIDGYELLAPLDEWFRAAFLPSLPTETVTVLAGRSAPSDAWWLDAGWRALSTAHELVPLSGAESDQLLEQLGVPDDRRADLARLAGGHPLVLALLAEASRRRPGLAELDDAPDVVSRLCVRIMDDVPSPAHRLGLATCAHAAQATQDLLARTVGDRADEVWDWLAERPYVRHGPNGLYLHDVVSELFEAEFRHRSPEGYVALHRAVRTYFLQRVDDPREAHPERAANELLLLHRGGPLTARMAGVPAATLPTLHRATPADHGWMLELIERDEGARAARIARRWLALPTSRPYRIRVDGGPAALTLHGYLTAPPDDLDDPVATTIWSLVARHGPLRQGERIDVCRFGAATGGWGDPLLLLVNGAACVLEWRLRASAWRFIVTPDPEGYGPYFEYLGMERMFTVDLGDGPVGGWGWDRRRLDVPAFDDMMATRELTGEMGPPPEHLLPPAPLGRDEFDQAVRMALSVLRRPDRLADSPLLGSGLVQRPDAGELAAVLTGTIERLADEPKGAEHRRVLERTYLHGAPSQEVAADLLDLPFSTYRRHLALAVQRLCDVLWAVETGVVTPQTEQKVSSDRPGE